VDHQEGAACHLEEWAAWVKCNKQTNKKVIQKGNLSKENLFSFFVIIKYSWSFSSFVGFTRPVFRQNPIIMIQQPYYCI
jgi:hypothetical protein